MEIVAPVAPLKDILLAYIDQHRYGHEWDAEFWKETDFVDEFDDLGLFEVDDDTDLPIYLADTQMMLIAERAETANIQAILIQPSGDSSFLTRIGWFIHKPTVEEMKEEDLDDRDFEPMRKIFKRERRILL